MYNNSQYGFVPPVNSGYTTPNYNAINQPMITQTNKIYVSGKEDAQSRILPPNSDYIFLDNNKPIIYQKIVNGSGQFEFKMFDIIPHKEETETSSVTSVSREEFEELKTKIDKLLEVKNESVG